MLRSRLVLVVGLGGTALVAVGVLAGVLVTRLTIDSNVTPRSVRGTVTGVNASGTALVFRADESGDDDSGRSYGLRNPVWLDRDGAVHLEGAPACAQPGSTDQRKVELQFVDVNGERQGIGNFPLIVGVHCLD
jgi:hypothetical protein